MDVTPSKRNPSNLYSSTHHLAFESRNRSVSQLPAATSFQLMFCDMANIFVACIEAMICLCCPPSILACMSACHHLVQQLMRIVQSHCCQPDWHVHQQPYAQAHEHTVLTAYPDVTAQGLTKHDMHGCAGLQWISILLLALAAVTAQCVATECLLLGCKCVPAGKP